MTNIELARQIIFDWRQTPPPKAGVLDTDTTLANLIAAELDRAKSKEVKVAEREVSTSGELSGAIWQVQELREKKSEVERKLFALCDEMEQRTFGSGIATYDDLFKVAAKIREIVRTT